MAIVDYREMYRGRGRTASFGDTPVYTRVFLVRTDTTDTSMGDIAAAPQCDWLSAHPENQYALLIDSSTSQDGDSPFHYKVQFTYKTGVDLVELPWNRPPQFSFSGSLASAPAFWYYSSGDNTTKQIIINSAGDPLGGLDRDEGEFNVTISANLHADGTAPFFSYAEAQAYVGAINSDNYSGGAPRTWKCQTISASRKVEQVHDEKLVYWEVNTTLAYRNTGWDLQTWDVGFNEIVSGVRKKIMAGSEPVSEPAALLNGRAKPPGQPPEMKTFRIYPMLPFVGKFPALP